MELKIGVLLARSDMFPKLAMDFLNGLKLAFKDQQQPNPKLLFESIGNATDESLLQRIEKLILQEDVDVIVTFCSFYMIEKLAAIANSYQKPIIHVSLGARVLNNVHASPYMLYQSLNLTQSSYLSGKLAAETIGKKGAIAASFYDGGYHMAEAFVNGFTDYGGEIIFNYVSQMDYKQDDFQTMVEGIKTYAPDVLFTMFSFKEAERVLEVLAEPALGGLPVVALPLMVDQSLKMPEVGPKNVQSVASWAFEEDSDLMNSFKNSYENNFSEMPNLFGLLGNEVGVVLTNALQQEGKVPAPIGTYMASKTIQSPRGELRYTERNESIPMTFKVRQLSAQGGNCYNEVVGQTDASAADIIYKKMEDIPPSGWKNPYICT